MERHARVSIRERSVTLYLEDPDIPREVLGPLGNFVRVFYRVDGTRSHYDAAIRGYGEDGRALAERLATMADRLAAGRRLAANPGPASERQIGRLRF